MADVNKAIDYVLSHEGEYSYNEQDHGGPTNFGISLRYLKAFGTEVDFDGDGDVDSDDVKLISKSRATEIYKKEWWNKLQYENIEDDLVASKVFDMAINMGAANANRLLQKAVNLANHTNFLEEDGVLGPKSFKAINDSVEENLLPIYVCLLVAHYLKICEKNPSQQVFMTGWLHRALDIPS